MTEFLKQIGNGEAPVVLANSIVWQIRTIKRRVELSSEISIDEALRISARCAVAGLPERTLNLLLNSSDLLWRDLYKAKNIIAEVLNGRQDNDGPRAINPEEVVDMIKRIEERLGLSPLAESEEDRKIAVKNAVSDLTDSALRELITSSDSSWRRLVKERQIVIGVWGSRQGMFLRKFL